MIGDPNQVVDHYLYTDDESVKVRNVEGNKSEQADLLVDIISVKFFDKFGHENNTFVSGDDIVMRVQILSKIEVKNPNVGFIIYDDEDNYIFGSNTEIKGARLPDIGIGTNVVQITLPACPLLNGKFFITVAIGDMKYTVTYVWKDKAYAFYVNPSSRTLGIVDLSYYYN